MENTEFSQNFQDSAETAEFGMLILFLFIFLMHQFLAGGLKYMLSLFRSLQMIFHFPLMQIILPGNLASFYEIMIPLIMFDILENDYGWDATAIFTFDDEK